MLSLDVQVKTLMMIDSLEMTDNDRKYILDSCKHAKEDLIIVVKEKKVKEKIEKKI